MPREHTAPPPTPAFALRGQTLAFRADPFAVAADAAVDFNADGAVVMAGGTIVDVGPAADVLARRPGIRVEHYPGHLIMAGFIDSHAHYPQTEIIASYGTQLIDWLKKYTFPAEANFADGDHASAMAEVYLDECLRQGTTTASVYCTVHPQSVDAFFMAARARGLRMAAGKVMMDRNAPDGLRDSAQDGYDQTKALIARWHGVDRLVYAVTPRFAITSTPAQLESAAAVWREHPGTLLQTHLGESKAEIAWIETLFPDARDYTGVYERHGLLGPGANFGHAIHLGAREIAALRDSGSAISHCPTSNTFIGSGLFDLAGLRAARDPLTVGLATDVGGGSSFSMLATMKAAYEIGQLRGASLHPAQAYYLATVGSAAALRMEGQVGNLAVGYEADVIVLDLQSRPILRQRMRHARDLWDALFVLMILGDDRAVRATYVAGRAVYRRPDEGSASAEKNC